MVISISASVGFGGRNKPTDVALIQQLLKNANTQELVIDGLAGHATFGAIKAFQKDVLKFFKPDSLISPHGKTFKRLKIYNKTTSIPLNNSNSGIVTNRFLVLFQKEFSALNSASLTGLTHIINFIINDPDVTDIRWSAYMLATTKHETGSTMLPIEEYGKGRNKPYGKEITVTDKNGRDHKNIYYGRGYVQITWDANYKKLSSNLAMGEELYIYPDKVLDEIIAYNIMSYGMRNGSFTSSKLSHYIKGGQCDYINARRIINGMDKAQIIASYATTIEILLRLSRTYTHSHNEGFDCSSNSRVCIA